jgi:hypothetical protein
MSNSKEEEAHVGGGGYQHGYPPNMGEYPQSNPGRAPYQGQSPPVIIHAISLGDESVEMICPHCASHIRYILLKLYLLLSKVEFLLVQVLIKKSFFLRSV